MTGYEVESFPSGIEPVASISSVQVPFDWHTAHCDPDPTSHYNLTIPSLSNIFSETGGGWLMFAPLVSVAIQSMIESIPNRQCIYLGESEDNADDKLLSFSISHRWLPKFQLTRENYKYYVGETSGELVGSASSTLSMMTERSDTSVSIVLHNICSNRNPLARSPLGQVGKIIKIRTITRNLEGSSINLLGNLMSVPITSISADDDTITYSGNEEKNYLAYPNYINFDAPEEDTSKKYEFIVSQALSMSLKHDGVLISLPLNIVTMGLEAGIKIRLNGKRYRVQNVSMNAQVYQGSLYGTVDLDCILFGGSTISYMPPIFA